jgi:hypothetical protein
MLNSRVLTSRTVTVEEEREWHSENSGYHRLLLSIIIINKQKRTLRERLKFTSLLQRLEDEDDNHRVREVREAGDASAGRD